MIALESQIAERAAGVFAATVPDPELGTWQIRKGTEETSRKVHPAVDIRIGAAQPDDIRNTAVSVGVTWAVSLIVPKGEDALAKLDKGFAKVISLFHNWQPAEAGGRAWQRMKISGIAEAESVETGLIAYTLNFDTSAGYAGQN